MILGPVCGSYLNKYLGFSVPLYILALLFLIISILTIIHIPNDDLSLNSVGRKKSKLPINRAIKNKSVNLFYFIIYVVCNKYKLKKKNLDSYYIYDIGYH